MLKIVRLDDRLVHGQLINNWCTYENITEIIVVNKEVAENGIRKTFIELSVPEDVKIIFCDTLKALELIGDPIIWGIIRPVIAAVCAGIALNGNVAGPISFFIIINIIRFIIRYNGLMISYREGTNVINKLKGTVPRLRSALTVLTYTVIGGLVAKWTVIKVPFVLYTLKQEGTITSYTVQEQLDNIMPNILPLLLTFLVYWLLNKKVSPLTCMLGLMLFGVIGYALGILGT